MSWIPLHVHSQYSILEALPSTKALAKRAQENGMPALALTDYGMMYGAVEFYKACRANDIKPIIGCCLYVATKSRFEKERGIGNRYSYPVVLLAKNRRGYENLCILSSKGHIEGFYYKPRIDKELLAQHSEGLVCLGGGVHSSVGIIAAEGTTEQLKEEMQWYKDTFGEDYYLELHRHTMTEDDLENDGMFRESWLYQKYQDGISRERKVEKIGREVAKSLEIQCVATNASHYLDRDDWYAHEILLNVQSGEPCEIWEKDSMGNNKTRIPNPKRKTFFSHSMEFKTVAQMQELFKDIPEALETSLHIAEKCNVEIDFDTKHYPLFIPPALEGKEFTKEEQVEEAAAYLKSLCLERIPVRYTPENLAEVEKKYPGKDPIAVVNDRLEYELGVILGKNLSDYLLIVWDFIFWAKGNGIAVGPGRGSGAGSIILYLLGITDIEPLRFNLFFERFINPERMSYPDIDVDICMEKRGSVIDYTLNKYGKDNVAQIITFGSMKAKSSVKDVGRVLSVPLTKVNTIAKYIPEELNITIDKALEIDKDLQNMYATDEETQQIIDIGKKLEGAIRSTGIHAAGVIISSEPLVNHIPICRSKDSEIPATQYSMKPVEAVGMLKVDFLGLKTLTGIQKAVRSIKKNTGREIDPIKLPLDDKETFKLLNQGKTLGVFQLESAGMQELAKQLHLDCFEEIIAVVSLYRPGPMDMIPSFIARKHGREPIEYDHPMVKDILDETYGIMVYQEQVMHIAQELANYSLGEGDVLRRAMGKKDAEEMGRQRDKFIQGAKDNDIPEDVAVTIFDKMEKFAAYGFNKSHAAAYGFISYITAYLKANYPREWMAALLTCDRDDITKVAKFIRECQAMDIPILPPDINEAGHEFVATEKGIRFAMLGIKGVGEGVVDAIVEERDKNGPYKCMHDFIKRCYDKKVGKKVIENLVDAGSFDFTGWSRDGLRISIETMYDVVVKEEKEKARGVMSLFSLMDEEDANANFLNEPKVVNATSQCDIFMKEKSLLGFFLTGHPMKLYEKTLRTLSCVPLRKVEELEADTIFRTAFIVESLNVRISAKTQKKFAIMEISDGMERYELPVWPEMYEEKGHMLFENQLLYAVIQVEKKEGTTRLSCRWFDELKKANDTMIEECDRAFDKAKLMAERMRMRASMPKKEKSAEKKQKKKDDGKKTMKKDEDERTEKPLLVSLDADTATMNGVLAMKKAFGEHSGGRAAKIDFQRDGSPFASVDIDSKWGVEASPEFNKKMKDIPGVIVES
jgi:DNA polymerase III subunit alpha